MAEELKILSDFSHNTCKKSILGQREQLGEKLLSDLSRNNRDTCKVSTLGQWELYGAKVLSTIKGIESDEIKSELSLDLFMRMERELDGRWAIVWSEVNEVGPKQSIKPIGHNFIPFSPFITAKPKSVWRPRPSQTLVNPAHCQNLKSELVAQVLGSQVQMQMEIPLPLERKVGASSSVCGDPVTGKESESRCSSNIANLDSSKVFFGSTSP